MATTERREILSTLFSADAPIDDWQREVDMLRPRGQLATIAQIARRAARYRAVVLDGSAHRDQVVAALLSRRREPPVTVIADATWKVGSNPLDETINRIGIRAIDGPHVTYCVHSTCELESFQRTWGPLSGRVRFTPWPYTLSDDELAREPSDNGRVFAGGNSLRDYDTLIAAAATLAAPVDIATSTLRSDQLARLPSTVRARKAPPDVFNQMLHDASVVVVPLQLRHDRGAGQSTYVDAMAKGKAVVVTDVPGARDYIEDGETGVIVPPNDSSALRSAIARLLDDPLERQRIGSQARRHVLAHLSLQSYATRLLELVHEALGS